METLLLGSLGYLGNQMNNQEEIKNKTPKKTKKNKKQIKKVYNTTLCDKVDNATKKQAKRLKESGFAKQFDTIMFDNVGGPVSVNQSNNVKGSNFNGFDTSLQRDIDFQNGYSEFGKTQMHYDVVPQIEMMTNNMTPHSSKRDLTNYNQDHGHLLGLYTGTDQFYMSKDNFDPVPLFEPMKDLTYVNGAPVMTDILETRYVPSEKNNNGDLPFAANLKVAPGINGEAQDGRNSVYRILPKSTEELRSKTNQKISYKADKIEAVQKGQYRPAPDNLTKYKIPTYRERKINDYLPNSGEVNKQKVTGKFQNLNTHRSTSMNVVGHAHDSSQGNRKNGKIAESGKITYANDSIARAVSNVSTKPVLQNKKSYRNVENERDSTNHNIPGAAVSKTEGSYTFDPKDIPLTTLRQLMVDGDTNIGITQNRNNNTYVFSKDCVIPNTIRSVNSHNTKEGFMNPITKEVPVFDKEDIARSTIRQTTSKSTVVGTVNPVQRESHYYNDNDKARQTVKETTEHLTVVGTLNPEQKESHYYNDNDTARQTIRQTTGYLGVEGPLNPEHREGIYFNENDVAKQTIKETTSHMNRVCTINPVIKEGHYFNDNDTARDTIRQTTGMLNRSSAIQPVENAPTYVDYNDVPDINIRNTTSHAEYISNTNRTQGNNQYMYNAKEEARPTIRHTTGLSEYVGNTNRAEGTNVYMHNSREKARPTIRHTTGLSEYVGNTNRSQGNVVLGKKDIAKPTIKETTLYNAPAQNTVRTTQGNVIIGKNDSAKQTIKETTLYNAPPQNTNRTTQGNVIIGKGDKAKPTIKSTTLHSSRGHVANNSGTVGYSRDEKDEAKQTVRQTTLHSSRGNVANNSGTVGYSRDEKDEAKQTVRQTTLHSTQEGRLGRQCGGEQYVRDEKDEAKQTVKQTTLHSTQEGRIGKQEGGVHYVRDEKDKARVTIKQTTLLENHTGPLRSEVENKQSHQAAENMTTDERREILTYNRPTGPKSDRVGPIINKSNIKLKEENFIKRTNYGFDKSNCNMGQLTKTFTRNKQLLSVPNYRINDDFINTLQDNPLVNDLMHQKNK